MITGVEMELTVFNEKRDDSYAVRLFKNASDKELAFLIWNSSGIVKKFKGNDLYKIIDGLFK